MKYNEVKGWKKRLCERTIVTGRTKAETRAITEENFIVQKSWKVGWLIDDQPLESQAL